LSSVPSRPKKIEKYERKKYESRSFPISVQPPSLHDGAVAEFVSAQGKGEAAVTPLAPANAPANVFAPPPALWFAARACSFAVLCLFGLQPLLVDVAHAQATLPVTPDRNASGPHPVIGVAGNGVPVVNIVAPNAAGLSHNIYTDYNVGQKGLVLNNSGQNSQTQTAGWVQGNPFMGNQSARTILNEVTSGKPPSRRTR
jgi:filamentous hemagglutinin